MNTKILSLLLASLFILHVSAEMSSEAQQHTDVAMELL